MQFHHLGVACRSFEREIEHFRSLGYEPSSPVFEDHFQKVRVQFLEGGGPRVELVCALTSIDASPLVSALNNGTRFYHMAYEVSAFDDTIARLQSQRGKLVAPPTPAIAFNGRRVAFVMQPTLTLIELIEIK
jgi:methylmalonyl-CoA/ethylmalonyl-CoA epimerase